MMPTVWLGLALLLDTALVVVLAIGTPGHDLVHDYASEVGATGQPLATGFQVVGIATAAAHLAFLAAIHRWGQSDPWRRTGLVLAAVFFALLGIGMLFQCDPGCTLETVAAQTHFWLGLSGFVALGLAAIAMAVAAWLRRPAGWMPVVATSAVLGIADVALLVGDLTGSYRGLVERLTVLAMMVWSMALWRAWMLSAPAVPENPAMPPR